MVAVVVAVTAEAIASFRGGVQHRPGPVHTCTHDLRVAGRCRNNTPIAHRADL